MGALGVAFFGMISFSSECSSAISVTVFSTGS